MTPNACNGCGAAIPAGDRFCTYCARPTGATAVETRAAEATAPSGPRGTLAQCRTCSKPVAASVQQCPHCGEDWPVVFETFCLGCKQVHDVPDLRAWRGQNGALMQHKDNGIRVYMCDPCHVKRESHSNVAGMIGGILFLVIAVIVLALSVG